MEGTLDSSVFLLIQLKPSYKLSKSLLNPVQSGLELCGIMNTFIYLYTH